MDSRNIQTNDEIDLIELIAPLVERWKLLLLIFVIGATLAFVYSRSLPKTYQSNATIFVQQSSPGASILRNLPISVTSAGGGASSYLVTLLQSEALLGKVISQLDLVKDRDFVGDKPTTRIDTLEALKESIAVAENKNGTINVAAEAHNPELAARIVNVMLDSLGSFVVTSSKRKAEFISKKIDETTGELSEAEHELMLFLEKNSIADITEETNELIKQLGELDGRLLVLNEELQGVSSDLANASELNSLVEQEVRRKSVQASRDYVMTKRDELRAKLTHLPAVAVQYARLQREVMVLSKTYELLIEQYQMANITQKGEDGDYQIVDRARPIPKKVAPRMLTNTAAGGLLCFLLAALIINIRASIQRNRKRLSTAYRRGTTEAPSIPRPVKRV